MNVIVVPKLDNILSEEIGGTMVNLYKYIKDELKIKGRVDVDPRHIIMNEEDLKELIFDIQSNFFKDDHLKIGLMWMNQGPSGSNNIPRGKIYLYEGCMTPSEEDLTIEGRMSR